MVIGSASVQKTGMITLPKKWRDRHPAKTVFFEDTPKGLLVRPYDDIQYWEDDKGNFGLHFPMGIEAGRLHAMFQAARKKLDAAKKPRKRLQKHRQK